VSLFRGINISASGLRAGRARIDTIAQNIANVDSRAEDGTPYRRKQVVLAPAPTSLRPTRGPSRAGGVMIMGLQEDTSEPQMVYRPDDPSANAQGYVALPNVSLPVEMVDMVAATRAYEANTAALRAGRDLAKRTLDILR